MDYPCLILTADYRPKSLLPLSTIPWQESFRLFFLKKITVLDWYSHVVHTATTEYRIPALAAVKRFSYAKSDKSVRFTRQNIFLRDSHRCAYCGEVFVTHELTVDHLIPTSKGGKNNFFNTITACRACNSAKGDSVGVWKPLWEPFNPDYKSLIARKQIIAHQIKHASWEPFLL